MSKYFLTKLTKGGSIFGESLSDTEQQYYSDMKVNMPEAIQVNLGELYQALGKNDGTGVEIIFSKFVGNPNAIAILKSKYPKAKYTISKELSEANQGKYSKYKSQAHERNTWLRGIPGVSNILDKRAKK